jgi:mono/diheme cytochrome c family protein
VVRFPVLALLAGVTACGSASAPSPTAFLGVVPSTAQRPGDPARGFQELTTGDYVGCGFPADAYAQISPLLGSVDPGDLLDRAGPGKDLPYDVNAFVTKTGVTVVAPSCLACHAGHILGKLVIGLGDTSANFTEDRSGLVPLVDGLVEGDDARAEWQTFADRLTALGPYMVVATVGLSPADNIAPVLAAHRDPHTLAWSNTLAPNVKLAPAVPIDVPPWWRMKKKHALYYNAAGRGDHARLMMSASMFCTDSVADATRIDAAFPDVRAYIESLTPPAYPFPIDAAAAARGKTVFAGTCARCHGDNTEDGYPNLVVAASVVGTDPTLASDGTNAVYAGTFLDWFRASFYGEKSQLEPAPGYIAPPLDGIWATAPYLHNGSVPTLAALLDSRTRPTYWTRSYDSNDYDDRALGWRFTALDHGQADEPDPNVRRKIYDTTLPGYAATGHTFGDDLTDADRADLLEYLKQL